MIYLANSWRTLQVIGWHHAEPILRSVVYALLDHDGSNPAQRDAPADRPGRRNWELSADAPNQWEGGHSVEAGNSALLAVFRKESAAESAQALRQQWEKGAGSKAIWDAVFQGAAELLMRQPGLVSLHALTSTNAFYYCYRTTREERLRRYLLLQNVSFLPLFRGTPKDSILQIDSLEPKASDLEAKLALDDIFASLRQDKLGAAAKALAFLSEPERAGILIARARELIFEKGRDSHDYKFSAAVLEDYFHISPAHRNRYLAASLFSLRSSGENSNELSQRIRGALAV